MSERLSSQLEQIILAKIAHDKLAVATMPAIAARCLAALKDANVTLKRLISIIEQDPVIAARVFRLANSAAYGGGGALKTLETAVARLGLAKLRTLLIEVSARQIFESRDPRIARATRGLWEHSLAVALIARDLSALAGREADMDTAYLCGLLHDVGKPIVASMLLEAERLTMAAERSASWMTSDDWIKAVERSHRAVGVALAQRWQLPEHIVAAIRDCSDFDNADRHAPANYVRFANAVAKREGFHVGAIDSDDVMALIMIGRSLLEVNDDILGKLTATLRERVTVQAD